MRLVLLFALIAPALFAEVTLTRSAGHVDVAINGKPFTSFFFGGEGNKPYLHPLRAPSGTIVTRRYPMEEVPGESRDHPHHRGLWFSHGDVNGFDFWANDDSQRSAKTGKIVLDRFVRAQSGAKSGILEATFRWQDAQGKTLLNERRRMTFLEDPRNRIIDFDIELTALDKVTFGDTKEGTFAIRLSDAFTEKSGHAQMINAAGASGMKQVWGKPSPWVDYSGTLAGEALGVAIFDHPGNPKHPTYWHARDYGLFAANIFGEHDFFNDKSRDGSVHLEAGKSLRFRYRAVIHPGDRTAAGIANLYQTWAGGAK